MLNFLCCSQSAPVSKSLCDIDIYQRACQAAWGYGSVYACLINAAKRPQVAAGFGNVQCVSIASFDQLDLIMGFDELVPLFFLPCMTSIYAHRVVDYTSDPSNRALDLMTVVKASNLTDVHIDEGYLDSETLITMLQAPKALKRLHYHPGDEYFEEIGFLPAEMGKALIAQRNSLEVLEIPDHTGDGGDNVWADDKDPYSWILSSLRGFIILMTIDARLDLLIGSRYWRNGRYVSSGPIHRLIYILPTSLQQFTLRHSQKCSTYLGQLVELIEHSAADSSSSRQSLFGLAV